MDKYDQLSLPSFQSGKEHPFVNTVKHSMICDPAQDELEAYGKVQEIRDIESKADFIKKKKWQFGTCSYKERERDGFQTEGQNVWSNTPNLKPSRSTFYPKIRHFIKWKSVFLSGYQLITAV